MINHRLAVMATFAFNGAMFGSWAPRVPALSEHVDAGPGPLGLALFGGSVGMTLAASVSGRLVEWLGVRVAVAGSALATCVLLPVLGTASSVLWLALALAGFGAVMGVLDVAMNIGGVAVERRLGRPLMPMFHAGFSIGALAGSGAAALAAAGGWSPLRHFVVAALAGAVLVAVIVRALPEMAPRVQAGDPPPTRGTALVRRPVLWLLAAIALCSAVAEGGSADWSALLLVTEQGAGEGTAALAFTGFSLAMALARLAGSWAQAKFGPARLLVAGTACAGIGLVAAALGGNVGVSYAGFALAGAGLSACFPVALGLAGETGKRPDGSGGEREVAFVTAIAYAGFLAGPPAIGGIAHLTSLSVSFVVVGLVAVAIAPVSVAATRAVARGRADQPRPVVR